MNNDIPRDITKYTSKMQMPVGRMDFIKTTENMPVRMEQIPLEIQWKNLLKIRLQRKLK